MKQYLDSLRNIRSFGTLTTDRTGKGRKKIFGEVMKFDLIETHPHVTTTQTIFKPMVAELLWFLEGSTDNNRLHELGAKFWDKWATEEGDLGPIYGAQWRSFGAGEEPVDQIKILIDNLKNNPFSSRHIVSAWNPSQLPDESISPQENADQGKMALAPCHCLFQFHVIPLDIPTRVRWMMSQDKIAEATGGKRMDFGVTDPALFTNRNYFFEAKRILELNGIPENGLVCQLYQRSADFPVGVPVNISSYSLLTRMVAQCVNMIPKEFIWTGGDCHIYPDQEEGVFNQITRQPLDLPKIWINPDVKDIFSFKIEDFKLIGYRYHPKIVYEVAV